MKRRFFHETVDCIPMSIGARISVTNEPKQDTAFDCQSELNRFVKEDKFTCNSTYFKKIRRNVSENGTRE
jgi:hypothetical protein